jgi:Ras-related protein Rab-7A
MRQSEAGTDYLGASSILTTKDRKKIFLKVVVIGDKNVGKSSLIKQFVYKKFSEHLDVTVGGDFINKEYVINDNVCMLQIMDTAG